MLQLFYKLDYSPKTISKGPRHSLPLDSEYRQELWQPSISKILPSGFSHGSFSVWWLFHQLHIFSNSEYSVFTIYKNGKLIHRSGIYPRYFRFPFMAPKDLQIGDTWTAESERGKGLAKFALSEIAKNFNKTGRSLWYLAEEDNIPSQKVAEAVGFYLAGRGKRSKRLGLRLFGQYILEQPAPRLVTKLAGQGLDEKKGPSSRHTNGWFGQPL